MSTYDDTGKVMNPLISIIVPVYKVEPYLHRCVDSILAQTYTNIEVILVDDGSPDGCPAICDEYAAKDNRIVVIHQGNAGVSAARNAGLDAAHGEYIGFVDSDDWIEPDMYEVLYDTLNKTGADISSSGFSRVDKTEGVNSITTSYSKEEALCAMFSANGIQPCVCGKLFSANSLNDVRFDSNITIGEDTLVATKAIYKSNVITSIPYKAYHYTDNNNSAVHTYKESYWSIQKASDLIVDEVKSISEKTVAFAKSRSIDCDISLAIFAADTAHLDKSNYKRLHDHIVIYNDNDSRKLLGMKCQLWLMLFHLGRLPFIVGRKIYRKWSNIFK